MGKKRPQLPAILMSMNCRVYRSGFDGHFENWNILEQIKKIDGYFLFNAKDPDSLIQFQVWTTDYRNRGTLRGRVDVPLYAVGRKGQREMQLLLKDVYRPKGESCGLGYLNLGNGSPFSNQTGIRI